MFVLDVLIHKYKRVMAHQMQWDMQDAIDA